MSANNLFFEKTELEQQKVEQIIGDALKNSEDGELYLEYGISEGISLQDGHIKNSSYNTGQGFGLRSVIGELAGYAHSTEISYDALKRAAQTVRSVENGYSGSHAVAPKMHDQKFYTDHNPITGFPFKKKLELLNDIDRYLRAQDNRIKQVSTSLGGSWDTITIMRPDGLIITDVRPMVRLSISVLVGDKEKQEIGYYGTGGRVTYDEFFTPDSWERYADEALRKALVNLEAIHAPAGNMPVVLGSGTTGVLLHEAVGHGLEGDFNRKKTSNFSGKIGQQVAAKGVTVVDDGTFQDRRGSLSVDDEGTPTQRNVLIEDGKLVGYMQDRQNARLMGMQPTGNGRRESFAHVPMPRMTNTFMLAGESDPEEILKSVNNGLYAVDFSGGQVDITNGKFTFSASEAYMIENGKIGAPVKGAMLIGDGPDVMTKITMIGNDLTYDPGGFTCGKNGQSVPVGIGMPSVLVSSVTVGGSKA